MERLGARWNGHVVAVNEVAIDSRHGRALRFGSWCRVFEELFHWDVEQREADDHTVDVRLAARLAGPFKYPVREVDLEPFGEEGRPQRGNLFALDDRTGGHQGALHEAIRFAEIDAKPIPAADIVDDAGCFRAEHPLHIGFLFHREEF
jgi:hypothetical protein